MNTQKRIVVTGGAGFIGSHVVKMLLDEGHSVAVVDILPPGRPCTSVNLRWYIDDIDNTAEIAKICTNADAVIHLAGKHGSYYSHTYEEETHRLNVLGTLSVLDAARRAGVSRFVYASAGDVYGDGLLPHTEESVPKPLSPYGEQKLAAELQMMSYARMYNMDAVSLRIFSTYGPGMEMGLNASVLGKFVAYEHAKTPALIYGDGSQTRDFVYVEDVARALVRTATEDIPHGYHAWNVGSGVPMSIERLSYCFELREVKHNRSYHTSVKNSVADISLIQKMLGWTPRVSLAEGIVSIHESL